MKPRVKPKEVVHFRASFQAKQDTICGQPIWDRRKKGVITPVAGHTMAFRWSEVTCKKCLKKKPKVIHFLRGGLHTMCGLVLTDETRATDAVSSFSQDRRECNCEVCRRRTPAKKVHVPKHLSNVAGVVLENALVSARNRRERIVRQDCGYCDDRPRKQTTCCILCAFVTLREGDHEDMELFVAKKLGVPERWVVDMVTGWRGDNPYCEYPDAKRIGTNLWKKYGAAKKKEAKRG
jgi:hypothetical protein